mgnify:CR=1 FL=1|tara:strand:+ start:74 stop:913 length:840 start_codon:yes stop_codon:yes gene_type:complete
MALTKIQGKGIDDIDVSVAGELEVSSATGDSTDKRAFFVTKHYSSSEEDAAGVIIQSADGDTIVDVGGNSTSGYNAATKIRFYTAANNTTTTGTEAARIVGNKLLVGTTASFGGGNVGHAEFFESGNAAVGIGRNDSDLGACLRFFKVDSGGSGTIVGSVSLASSSTAYNTSSDYRLKTSVTYDWDATTRLKQLKPARFKWISDGESAEFVDGFLAHEAVTVVPEAVSGTKDATEKYTDEDGKEQTKIVPQGIDQSKLVPLLVKTIQELEARITALEAE